jgi:hypothetical protein
MTTPMLRTEGADETAADMRRHAATVDVPLRSDIQAVAAKIKQDYRDGVGRYSGRTAAGARFETDELASGLRAIVGNVHFTASFHEHGGARSAPNPALRAATDAHVPSWVDQVAMRRRWRG